MTWTAFLSASVLPWLLGSEHLLVSKGHREFRRSHVDRAIHLDGCKSRTSGCCVSVVLLVKALLQSVFV